MKCTDKTTLKSYLQDRKSSDMKTNYRKIFSGDALLVKRLVSKLHELGIEPVVKDEAESARLAGFASSMLGQVDLYVHKDEIEKAMIVVDPSSK